jgi:hypothetical protein
LAWHGCHGEARHAHEWGSPPDGGQAEVAWQTLVDAGRVDALQ